MKRTVVIGITVGATTIAVGLGLALWVYQAMQASDEVAAAKAESDRLRKMVTALQVVERKPEEFEREGQLLAGKQAVIDTILPPALGVSAFMEQYRALAQSLDVAVGDFRAREDVSGPVQQAEIVTSLVGTSEAIEALRVRTLGMRRLASWRPQPSDGSRTVVALTVYAFPGAAAAAPRPCRVADTRVWLVTYAARVEDARREWADLCRALGPLRATQARVDDYEAARARFQAMVAEIERLRSAR